jgi:hypothetical protein
MRTATIQIEIKCRLDEGHFAPWDELTPCQKKVFEKEFPNCEDYGAMSSWCEGCPFCVSFTDEVIDMEG